MKVLSGEWHRCFIGQLYCVWTREKLGNMEIDLLWNLLWDEMNIAISILLELGFRMFRWLCIKSTRILDIKWQLVGILDIKEPNYEFIWDLLYCSKDFFSWVLKIPKTKSLLVPKNIDKNAFRKKKRHILL